MTLYDAAIKEIIKKKLPIKIRREEMKLLKEIGDKKIKLDNTLKNVEVTIDYVSGDIHTQKIYSDCILPIEHRQLIDMILTGWSTVEQVKILQEQLSGYNRITKRPRNN
jgi:hypothetical protein